MGAQPGIDVALAVVPVSGGADLDGVLGSSTANPGLVFQPGATYPNASKWSGNLCNDLTALFAKARAMTGRRAIGFDLSNVGDTFTISATEIDPGGDTLFYGIRNGANSALPTLHFATGSTINPVGEMEFRDLELTVDATNAGGVLNPDGSSQFNYTFSGITNVISKAAGCPFIDTGAQIQIFMIDSSATPAGQGDSGNTRAAFQSTAGSNFEVELYDQASLALHAVDSHANVNFLSTAAFADPGLGAQINVFPGTTYTASGSPTAVGVTPVQVGAVYIDNTGNKIYNWDGSAWNQLGGGGTITLAGDTVGASNANQTTNLHIPAATVPPLGSGYTVVTPDNASGLAKELMAGDDWVHLTNDSPAKLNISFTFQVPSSGTSPGNFFRMDAEVHFVQVGAAGRAAFRRTVLVSNIAGTLQNPAGTTADGDNTPSTWTPSAAIAGSVAQIVMNNGAPGSLDVFGTRQAGVDTYARIASVSFAGGSSGH